MGADLSKAVEIKNFMATSKQKGMLALLSAKAPCFFLQTKPKHTPETHSVCI